MAHGIERRLQWEHAVVLRGNAVLALVLPKLAPFLFWTAWLAPGWIVAVLILQGVATLQAASVIR